MIEAGRTETGTSWLIYKVNRHDTPKNSLFPGLMIHGKCHNIFKV